MFRRCCHALALVASAPLLAQSITVTQAVAPMPVSAPFWGANVNHVGVYPFPGGQAAESFAGQTVTELPSGFETVTGTPSDPVWLLTPALNDGVWLYQHEIQGVANGTAAGDIGEGALSLRFHRDCASIGLDVRKGNGGTVTLQFFERDGAAFPPVLLTVNASQSYTFTATGGLIAGVTMTNDDPSGVSYDDLRLPLSTLLYDGCGEASIGPTAVPTVGSTFSFVLGGLEGIGLIAVGFAPSNQILCPTCVLGVGPGRLLHFGTTLAITIPNDPQFSGLHIYAQGVDVLASGGCVQPLPLTLTDAIRVTVQ